MYNVIEHKTKLKIQILIQNSKKLHVQTTDNNEAHQNFRTFLHIGNVVYNQSSLTFTTDKLLLLNKGLKFAFLPVKPPIENLQLQFTTAQHSLVYQLNKNEFHFQLVY